MFKRIIMSILLMITVVVSGCAEKDDSIELTLENYSQYLSVSGSYRMTGNSHKAEKNRTVYDSAAFETTVEGVSTNFNYIDVVVEVKYSGSYFPWKETGTDYWGLGAGTNSVGFEEDYVITCDVAGNGSASGEIVFKKPTSDLQENFNDVAFEVVAISGKVDPVK